jgi:hypothetical protein
MSCVKGSYEFKTPPSGLLPTVQIFYSDWYSNFLLLQLLVIAAAGLWFPVGWKPDGGMLIGQQHRRCSCYVTGADTLSCIACPVYLRYWGIIK